MNRFEIGLSNVPLNAKIATIDDYYFLCQLYEESINIFDNKDMLSKIVYFAKKYFESGKFQKSYQILRTASIPIEII